VEELLGGTDGKKAVVYAELLVNGKVVSSHDYFFAPFKDLTFSKPTITPEVTPMRGGFNIKVTTDKFAKAVYLSVPEHDGFFSDNFFNLAPGREISVEFRSRQPLSIEQFKERLQIRSVFDAF
jgi:beta-mannosidase